jgi:hypothetical protein
LFNRLPRPVRLALRALTVCVLAAGQVPAADAQTADIRLRLVAADGASLARYTAEAIAPRGVASGTLGPRGEGGPAIPVAWRGQAVRVQVIGPDGRRPFHPAIVDLRTAPAGAELWVVMVPEQWRIERGSYAGREIPIDLEAAFTAACRTCSSLYRRMAEPPPGYPLSHIPTWPERSLPIRVAFDRRQPGSQPVSPVDSAAFWAGARSLEEVLGRPLFRPAALPDLLPPQDEDYPDDILLVSLEPGLTEHGLGSAVSQRGDIFFGAVRLRSASLMHRPDGVRLLVHELLHAMGLGHTCGWRSIMADQRCPGRRATTLTAEDVAYFELLLAVREAQRDTGSPFGLEAALAGAQERAAGAGEGGGGAVLPFP